MTKEYTFSVNNLKRNNDSNNGVIQADFTCWILEGTYQASLTFSKEFTPNPSSGEYIAYSSLTENNVIGWLTEDEKTSVKTEVLAEWERLYGASPATLSDIPWGAAE